MAKIIAGGGATAAERHNKHRRCRRCSRRRRRIRAALAALKRRSARGQRTLRPEGARSRSTATACFAAIAATCSRHGRQGSLRELYHASGGGASPATCSLRATPRPLRPPPDWSQAARSSMHSHKLLHSHCRLSRSLSPRQVLPKWQNTSVQKAAITPCSFVSRLPTADSWSEQTRYWRLIRDAIAIGVPLGFQGTWRLR